MSNCQKLQGKTKEAAPGRNVDGEYSEILAGIRAGQVEKAVKVVEDRSPIFSGIFNRSAHSAGPESGILYT